MHESNFSLLSNTRMTRATLYQTLRNPTIKKPVEHPDKNTKQKYPILQFPDEELNDDANTEEARLLEIKKQEEREKEARRIADEIKHLMRLTKERKNKEKRNANTKRIRNIIKQEIQKSKRRQIEHMRKTLRNRIRRTLTVKHRPAFPRYR